MIPINNLIFGKKSTSLLDITVSSSSGIFSVTVSIVVNQLTGIPPYYIGFDGYVLVFTDEASALANTNWIEATSFSTSVPTFLEQVWLVAKDSTNTIVAKSTNVSYIAPLSFSITNNCVGLDITLTADNIVGGVGPYEISLNVFTSELDAVNNTSWESIITSKDFLLGSNNATYWIAVRDSTGTIFAKSIYAICMITPLSFSLSQSCSGTGNLSITLTANSIVGGTPPYQISSYVFTDINSALSNTSWISANSRSFILGNNPGEYWVSIKDSLGLIEVNNIYADCWNSLTASRESGALSTIGDINGSIVCGYVNPSLTNFIYVATHVANTLSVGDRVFQSSTGTNNFDGSSGTNQSKYWLISLQTSFSSCLDGTRVLIDQNGFILELYCCPENI